MDRPLSVVAAAYRGWGKSTGDDHSDSRLSKYTNDAHMSRELDGKDENVTKSDTEGR